MSRIACVLAVCLAFASSPDADSRVGKIDALLTAYHKQRYFNGSALVAECGKGREIIAKRVAGK